MLGALFDAVTDPNVLLATFAAIAVFATVYTVTMPFFERDTLAARLGSGDRDGAIAAYVAYLNRRSGTYMKLEAQAGSALDAERLTGRPPGEIVRGDTK